MSLLRRSALNQLRNACRKGGHKEKFWSQGTNEPGGLLFGETPPPPGQSRKWESWEMPWYFGLGAGTAIMSIGLSAKPDNLDNWADKKAAENLGATLKQQQ